MTELITTLSVFLVYAAAAGAVAVSISRAWNSRTVRFHDEDFE